MSYQRIVRQGIGVIILAAVIGSASLPAGGSVFDIVAQTGNGLTAIENSASIDRHGNVAFVASNTDGQGIYFYDGSSLTEIATDSSFTYGREIQLNDTGRVGAVRIRGGTRSANIWDVTSPDALVRIAASSTTVPRPAEQFEGIGNFVGLSNGGMLTFAGLSTGVWNVYLSDSLVEANGASQSIVSFPANNIFRPLAAGGDRVVIGSRQNESSWIYLNDPALGDNRFQAVATTTGGEWATLGLRPGITDDGGSVAFAGTNLTTAGIFGYNTSQPAGTPRWISIDAAARNAVSSVRGIDAASRIGVEIISSFFNNQLRLAFVGTNDNNQTSLYTARIDRTSGAVFGLTAVVSNGAQFNDATSGQIVGPLSEVSLSDSVNSLGAVAFRFGTSSGAGIAVYNGMHFTKYKQFADDTPLNTWAALPIHPSNENAPLFRVAGCYLTSLATVSGFFGQEITPLAMRDWLESRENGLNDRGGVNINTMLDAGSPFIQNVDGTRGIRFRDRGGSFNDIVTELRAGRPVMLGVPSIDQIDDGLVGGDLHAIVAYGIDPALGENDPVTPSHVYVSDPGSGRYTQIFGYGPGEEVVHVSLQHFFNRVSDRSSAYTFNPIDWFDNGTFIDSDGTTARLTNANQERDMTFFETSTGPFTPVGQLLVQSPVDVVLTEPTSGKRYVSAESLALPGDTVLKKLLFDLPGTMTDDDVVPIPSPDDPFPPYTLLLPDSLRGRNLDVAILGLGSGDYTIRMYTGDPDLLPSSPLVGMIQMGETHSGRFVVTVIPEPSAYMLIGLGIGVMAAWRSKAPEATK